MWNLGYYIVQRKLVFTGSSLHDSSQIRHRVEKIGNADGHRSLELGSPLLQLNISVNHVIEPGQQRFLAEIGLFLPDGRHFVELQGSGKHFHGFCDIQGTDKSKSEGF